MARPKKQTVDYFPHFVADSTTLRRLTRRWGNDGYAFWFRLLEQLCKKDNHTLDLSNIDEWEDLLDYTGVDDNIANDIMSFLSSHNNIDNELWVHSRIIWCQALIENLAPLYDKRVSSPPEKPPKKEFPVPETGVSVTETMVSGEDIEVSVTEMGVSGEQLGVSGCKVKESKVEESKEKERYILSSCHSTTCTQVIDYLNQLCGTNYNPSTKTTKQHINARVKEGYTFEDFKTVIDKKYYEWHNQPTMVQYLRPQTLFSTKFESYLNQPWVNPIKDNPTDIAIREFVRESQYIDQDDIIESTEGDDIF